MIKKIILLYILQILLSCNNQVAKKQYKISYNGNGHTSGSVPEDQSFYPEETAHIVYQKELKKENHILFEWNTKPDGTGISYFAYQQFQIDEDIELYANWEESTEGVSYRLPLHTNNINPNLESIEVYTFNKDISPNLIIARKYHGYEVKQIGYFRFNKSITTVKLPDSIEKIEKEAFNKCINLKSINLPEGLEIIERLAFNGCESLESIIIPEGVVIIGFAAFSTCKSLTSIALPDTLKIIDFEAFNNCYSLKKISIPKNVHKIGPYAFKSYNETEGLKEVTVFAEDPPEIHEDTFPSNLIKIKVPINSVKKYKTSKYWSIFESIIAGIEE